MFVKEKAAEIRTEYERFAARCPKKAAELQEILKGLPEEEALALQFTYSFMPVSDVVTLKIELILDFVKAALKARETTPWGKSIPVDLFLNFVLFYRINNENIVFYKESFYEALYPRIKGKGIKEAVLEVNYWCLEKGTYREADDRTLSPLAMVTGALGRCGEESVLTVAALRSVGIPARQCYVPKWAHCDDNHAWVEAWVDGKWQYLGACEPEAVLNKGWFTAAASKAMLVHAKAFANRVEGELITTKTPVFCTINNIHTYGKAKEIEVCVTAQGKPLQSITVRFELVNYSELFSICTLTTDAQGKVQFLTGMGDLHIHVTDGKKFMTQKLDVRSETKVAFSFEQAIEKGEGVAEFDMNPPKEDVSGMEAISEEKGLAHDVRFANCNALREAYEATFYDRKKATAQCEKYGEYADFFASVLVHSKGNHEALLQFLENSEFTAEDKFELLSTLREKDYTDCTTAVLLDYLKTAHPHKKHMEREIYVTAVLAPRVQNEMLLGERSFILDFFGAKKLQFTHAKAVWDYLTTHIQWMDDHDYPTVVAGAKGLLTYQMGSTLGISVLFVNTCRAFGIPARMNSVNEAKEFFENGEFIEIGEKILEKNNATLKILNTSGRVWNYFTEISVARLENGIYKTLSFWGTTIAESFTLPVKSGNFRILMSARQIDGSLLVRTYHFDIGAQETKTLEVSQRAEELAKKLVNAPLTDTVLTTLEGQSTTLFTEMTEKHAILAFVDVGKEPTEHLFNEICELADSYNARALDVLIVLHEAGDARNKTLQRTLESVPKIKLFSISDEAYLPKLHQLMGVGDERKPFVMAIDSAHRGLFAFSNYNVGTAATLLRMIDTPNPCV